MPPNEFEALGGLDAALLRGRKRSTSISLPPAFILSLREKRNLIEMLKECKQVTKSNKNGFTKKRQALNTTIPVAGVTDKRARKIQLLIRASG